tara:strand:- start:1264 stop:1443 length:180 start_codon:yes stop_codon:yes gene_type:complete
MTKEMEKMRQAFDDYEAKEGAMGRRIFALNLNQTAKQQGAARLLWLNIKQAFKRAPKGD